MARYNNIPNQDDGQDISPKKEYLVEAKVTLFLHTYATGTQEEAEQQAQQYFKDYNNWCEADDFVSEIINSEVQDGTEE